MYIHIVFNASQVNAIAFYKNKCAQLQEDLRIEREHVNEKRLPILFVTLSSQGDALRYFMYSM